MSEPRVQLDFAHRVCFTRHALEADNPALVEAFAIDPADGSRCLVVADQSLVHARPTLQRDLEAYFAHHAASLPALLGFRALPGGEAVKNDLSLLESLLGEMHRHRLDRRSYVLCLGGGALLDMVGFAASLVHRGLRLVRVPTTTLSQADSGVGVKHGVNMFGGKNFIGGFGVPWAVVNDPRLLDTLPPDVWRHGLAEAVKVALLKDADFYDTLSERRAALRLCDAPAGDAVWRRSAELHLRHITDPPEAGGGGDPYELTTARPLDFGHWSAHWLEQATNFSLPHGHAVAIGLSLDLTYAARLNLLDAAVARHAIHLLADLGLHTWHDQLLAADLPLAVAQFREHLGGPLTLTMVRGVGQPVEVHTLDMRALHDAVYALSAMQPALACLGGEDDDA